MPAARQIQPMGFPGRLEAMRAPTIGKGRQYGPQRCAYAPCAQLLGGWTGRVAICRATATRNKTTQSAASDQASHEVARALIPLAPCSCIWFFRSRDYSTVPPSPKRYGKRYEVEERANQHREAHEPRVRGQRATCDSRRPRRPRTRRMTRLRKPNSPIPCVPNIAACEECLRHLS